jgi:hypothetical protein
MAHFLPAFFLPFRFWLRNVFSAVDYCLCPE